LKQISLDLAYSFVSRYSQILPNEQFTLLTFLKMMGTNYNDPIEMSATGIAKLTGFDERTVQRHVAKLKVRNIITIENTYVGKGHYCGANKYVVVGWAEWVKKHA